MYKQIFITLFTSLLLISCNTEDPYLITATSVGPLTQETTVDELKTIFAKEKVVDENSEEGLQSRSNAIEIYDGDKQLLSLTPSTKEKNSTIKNIQIFDERYKTSEGIGLKSTFKDIKNAYKITKIETLLSSIVVFVDDINAYFTIDKKQLPSEMQFDFSGKVDAVHIPDNAQIKYFMIGW
ncbi:MAG: hypothetical protein V7767_10835 [Leeuwenhoekiella sp.]